MTTPNDEALLNDLLDGRLDPPAAEALRRRIAREPDLAATWNDLSRLRATLRSLPAPSVPEGFLEGVRRRASLPSAGGSAAPAGGPAGRILALRLWPLAAAAAVLIVGTVVVVVSRRGEGPSDVQSARTESHRTTEANRDELDRRKEHARLADEERATDAAAANERESAKKEENVERRSAPKPTADAFPVTPQPEGPFQHPGGYVPPGIRPPSDTPARGTPAPTPTPSLAARALPPAATAPPSPPVPDKEAGAEPAPSLAAGSSAATGGRPAPPRADGGASPPATGAKPASEPALRKLVPADPYAWARDGVALVLVVHAASVDDAKAQVDAFRAASRPTAGEEGTAAPAAAPAPSTSPTTPPPVPEPRRAKDGEGAGDDKAPERQNKEKNQEKGSETGKAGTGAPTSPPAGLMLGGPPPRPLEPLPAPGTAANESPVVIGSFVVDLPPEERERFAALATKPEALDHDAPPAGETQKADDAKPVKVRFVVVK